MSKTKTETKAQNKTEAYKKDKAIGPQAFYADFDEGTGLYCVFGSESGFAYSSWSGFDQAEEAAEAMANRLRDQMEEDRIAQSDAAQEALWG